MEEKTGKNAQLEGKTSLLHVFTYAQLRDECKRNMVKFSEIW
jgi:hypothetical protein